MNGQMRELGNALAKANELFEEMKNCPAGQEVFEKITDRLAEQYRKNRYESHNDEWSVGIDQAEQIVNEVAAEYNNGWIPCSERLPESKRGVLVNYKNGDFAVDFMHEDGKWFWEDEEEGLVVIAWQPLPAPYKPKED